VSPKAELRSRVALSDFIERVSARYGIAPSNDLSNREVSEICETSRKLTDVEDRTTPHHKITGRAAGRRVSRSAKPVSFEPSVRTFAGNHLSNEPPKAGKSPVFADLGALTVRFGQEEGPTTGISPVSALLAPVL
jgi:hypothetical protein